MTQALRSRGYTRFEFAVVVFLALGVAALAGNSFIPVDGWLYLASAKSLFANDFGTYYHWAREPGYPLFLRAVIQVSATTSSIAVAQHSIFGLSLLAAKQVLNLPRSATVLILLALVLPTTIGFSAAVLQQSIMASYLLLLSAAWLRFDENRSTRRCFVFIAVAAVGPIISIALVPTVAVTLLIAASASIRSKRWKLNRFALTTPLILLAAPFAPITVWISFKWAKWGFERQLDPLGNSYIWAWHHPLDVYVAGDGGRLRALRGLLGLGYDSHLPRSTQSRELFLFGYGAGPDPCGYRHMPPEPVAEYVDAIVVFTCVEDFAALFLHRASSASAALIIFVIVSSLFLSLSLHYCVEALHKSMQPWRFFAYPMWTLFITYLSLGAGISRYSFPMFGSALMIWAYFTLGESTTHSSRTSST